MRRAGQVFLASMALALGFLPGCGPSSSRRAVSGTVDFQSKPLDHGIITFYNTKGPPGPAGGALISDGRFAMPPAQGLDPGTYRVEISSPVPGGVLTPEEKAAGASPKAREQISNCYNTQSKLTAAVKADGANEFRFSVE